MLAELTRYSHSDPFQPQARPLHPYYTRPLPTNMTVQTLLEPQTKKRKLSRLLEDDAEPAPSSSLLIKRHSDKARIPTKGSPLAAGYDLYRYARRILRYHLHLMSMPDSAEEKVIPPHGKALVDTQISIAVPAGTYGRVAPRSGLGTCQSLWEL